MKNSFFLLFGTVVIFGCTSNKKLSYSNKDGFTISESGLQYKILKTGTGEYSDEGDEVLIYETTSYKNGTVIYSNEGTGNPIKVKIGANQATKGMDEGIRNMQEGEARMLILPPHLSRRKSYPPNLSADSTLMIKVILDKIL